MKKIGVWGLGVVGGAIAKAFSLCGKMQNQVYTYDIKDAGGNRSSMLDCDIIFMCLPTPTVNGKQDISIVENECKWLSFSNYAGELVIKSTVLPGTCSRLAETYKLKIVHNPEFLTAKNAFDDFVSQPNIMLGYTANNSDRVYDFYHSLNFIKTVLIYASEHTEMAKYAHNLYLATKLTFFNEMHEVCSRLDIDYNTVIDALINCTDATQENHTQVPGPDGKFGWGGMCFPKDCEALLSLAKTNGAAMEVLVSVIDANRRHRDK